MAELVDHYERLLDIMGMKRSAKAGDFSRAKSELENNQGYVEGCPSSILKKLGFDGGWKEFREFFPAEVVMIDVGRYAVISAKETPSTKTIREELLIPNNPRTFALCASNYVLGLGESTDFEPFNGRYSEIELLVHAMSEEIDVSIGAQHFPFDTGEVPFEFYRVERSLNYMANGGEFQVYGSAVLSQV